MSQYDQRGQHVGRDQYNVARDQYIAEHDIIIRQTPAEPQINLEEAEATYRQRVETVYNQLNFSGFEYADPSLTEVSLENIFVHLTLTVEKVIRELIPPEESNRQERRAERQRERVITVQEPVELAQALAQHLLIVGEPGAGKSTLLRWLAVNFAQGRQREADRLGPSADGDRLPVLVELGHLPEHYFRAEGGEAPNWIQFLPEYITKRQMAFTSIPPQLFTQALVAGRCLLLFDGLDEVASRQARTRLAQSMTELARLFPGNRVIIGSRPAGVSESALPSLFRHSYIVRFTPDDVHRFFHFWYALAVDERLTLEQRQAEADALYAKVQAIPALLQLATTPLLSTILVLIWRKEGVLPERRVELYERCCRVLIERWEASHDVAYPGALAGMDWEDHLRLLTPLAYAIHSQEQRTNATREELVPLLAQALQTARYSNEQAAATREARQFLDALSLRSGLLQYMGDDRYGFPHLTFQEYLAARYIAEQPDPEYIDLVMAHLHEAWWQEVHLLTIAHLGSGNLGASKASALILTILHVYTPPSRILRFSRNRWLRLIGPGKLLLQVQLERRIAWILVREFELASKGYAECVPNGTTAKVGTVLTAQATSLVRHIIYDWNRYEDQKALLTVTCRLLQRQGNEAVVSALLEALHDADWYVRWGAAASLGQVGVGNEAVVSALLEALHDADPNVQRRAAASLGHLEIKDKIQLRQILVAHNRYLYDMDNHVCQAALASIRQLSDGRPFPGYRWVPLRKQRALRLRLRKIAFWLGVVAILLLIALGSTWLLGYLNPNGFVLRYLGVLAALVAFTAAITQIRGWSLRDPWERR